MASAKQKTINWADIHVLRKNGDQLCTATCSDTHQLCNWSHFNLCLFFFFNNIFCKILFCCSHFCFPGYFKYGDCITEVRLWWVGISVPWVTFWVALSVSVLLRCGAWMVPEQMREDVPGLGTCWRIPKWQHLAETETLLIQQATKICV